MALMTWARTDEGLYVPFVFLVDGADGFVARAIPVLSTIYPFDADILDVNRDGHRREMVVSHNEGLTAVDLVTGLILWDWPAPDGLAGQAALSKGTTPLLITLNRTGALFAVYPSNGTLAWSVPGVDTWFGLWTAPLIVDSGASSGVVSMLPPVGSDPFGTILAPPRVRLIDLPARVTRWSVPLADASVDTFPLETSIGPAEEAGIVLSDGNRELAVRVSDGRVIWNTSLESPIVDSLYPPVVVPTPAGRSIVAPTHPNGLVRIDPRDGTSNVGARQSVEGAMRVLPADFQGDGFPEIITATYDGRIRIHSVPQFELLWNQSARSAFTACPALGDFDGDGGPELITVADDGWIDSYDLPNPPQSLPRGFDATLVTLGVLVALVSVVVVWIGLRRWNHKADTLTPGDESTAAPNAQPPKAKGKP